jgi:hypothetical protein
MSDKEVGRWTCARCGQPIVAAGRVVKTFPGIGGYVGPCPWDCGAWLNRGFRWIRPGQVKVYRAHEWDALQAASSGGSVRA